MKPTELKLNVAAHITPELLLAMDKATPEDLLIWRAHVLANPYSAITEVSDEIVKRINAVLQEKIGE